MSFRSIARDIRDSIGNLSRRAHGKSHGAVHEVHDRPEVVVQSGCWAGLPPELLRDVIKRLEDSESTWPDRKHVVACAAVCRSWREMCKDIVRCPEFSGKLTFPISLKQPGFREGPIQCFIKRDKSSLTYHLFLCLSPALLVETGKFLLSAKRNRRTTHTEYIISMDSHNISRSNNTYIGKLRSNFLGTKFVIYDTHPPHNISSSSSTLPPPGVATSHSKKVSSKVPSGAHSIAQVLYELNVLGTRGPRKMHCVMQCIPASSLEPGGFVPGPPELLIPSTLGDSFRSVGSSIDFGSTRFSDIVVTAPGEGDDVAKDGPLVLKNKAPRWHEQLQCWCLNFRGRVTVASVKNFQLVAAAAQATTAGGGPTAAPANTPSDQDKIILQFGKVGKDIFTMDYRYPLSAFQAFAICLSSFDTKLACE